MSEAFTTHVYAVSANYINSPQGLWEERGFLSSSCSLRFLHPLARSGEHLLCAHYV